MCTKANVIHSDERAKSSNTFSNLMKTNFRHSYFDREKNVIRSEYGFMPVKNATKRDPRIHVAYLTTSSEGMLESEDCH